MTQDASEVFTGLGVTKEMAEAALLRTQRSKRNGGICVCGHSALAHTEYVAEGKSAVHDAARKSGRNTCAPSKHVCPCQKYQEVLQTKDARRFRYATSGPAEEHALMKGVISAFIAGTDLWWDNEAECIKCKLGMLTVGAKLVPIAYDKRWYESKGPTDLNVLICESCRDEVEREWAGVADKARP